MRLAGSVNGSLHGGSGCSSNSSSATSSAASSNASSLTRSTSGSGLLQEEQENAAAALRPSPPRDPWHCRFFFEAARHCKEAFLKAWHDNELDTSKCIMLRNLWTKTSSQFAAGVDTTFGIVEQLQEVVGPAPTGSGPASCSPATRSKSHATQQAQMLSHPGSKDAMGLLCLPEELRQMDDGVAMLCGFMYLQDELFIYTNDRFASTFMAREELEDKVDSLAVLPILLLAEIFHPDDLPDVYAAIGSYWFRRRSGGRGGDSSAASEASWICKCIDKRNTEFTALVRYRSFASPTEGYPGAAMLSVLPLKQSKYLSDPDARVSLRMGTSSRMHLRDTLGALSTALPEHDDEELDLDEGDDNDDDDDDDSRFLDAQSDAMFRPLRRGMTVLSAEVGGPQAVPLSKQHSMPEPLHHHHLTGGTSHHSWSGQGTLERTGGASQYHHQQQQQQQQLPTSNRSDMSSMMDQELGTGASVVPTGQLTLAQLFLLQEGSSSSTNTSATNKAPAHQSTQLHHPLPQHREQEHPQLRHHVSPDGLAVEEEDSGSVGTDFELYGSSPSPEPALVSRSRQQLQQQQQQEEEEEEEQQDQSMPPPPHVAVPHLVRAVSGGAAFGSTGARTEDGDARETLSRSSSNTDLDMSCHGPADPNGYGGLQWTPAPLASLLGAAKGLLGGGSSSSSSSSRAAAVPRNQSPVKQKRRMSRNASTSRVPSKSGGSNNSNDTAAGGNVDPASIPGYLARSL